MRRIILITVLIVSMVRADGYLHNEEDSNTTFTEDALILLDECGSKDFSLCFKERALHYLDQLPNNIEMSNGISIKQNVGGEMRSGRNLFEPKAFPEEPRAREQAIDSVLTDRILDYLGTHTFEFKVPSETVNDLRRSFEEEGRKKKKKSGMPLMMLFQLKAATLGALALKAVALVAFKALIVGKLALMIAGIIALKKLFEQKHHTSTYEVVAHPHFDDHGHYDRSFSQELAYKGHDQTKPNSNF